MNLRVDLILDEEKRSASVLNAKSLIRMSIIIVPLAIVAMGVVGVINVMHSTLTLNNRNKSWEVAEIKEQEARDLRAEAGINNSIKNEMTGWRASQMDWHSQLLNIQRVAPRNMQFTRLHIGQTLKLVNNRHPARHLTLTLSGKSKGADSETQINEFIANLKSLKIFTDAMVDVVINDFSEDRDKDASRQDRVFEIECIYKAKEFLEQKKK